VNKKPWLNVLAFLLTLMYRWNLVNWRFCRIPALVSRKCNLLIHIWNKNQIFKTKKNNKKNNQIKKLNQTKNIQTKKTNKSISKSSLDLKPANLQAVNVDWRTRLFRHNVGYSSYRAQRNLRKLMQKKLKPNQGEGKNKQNISSLTHNLIEIK
jgi:hypothetical protein